MLDIMEETQGLVLFFNENGKTLLIVYTLIV